jgi:outer membrane protein TolC
MMMRKSEKLHFRQALAKFLVMVLVLMLFGTAAMTQPAYAVETLTLEQVIKRVQAYNSDLVLLSEELTFALWQQSEANRKVSDLASQLSGAENEARLSLAKQAFLEPLSAAFKVAGLQRDQTSKLLTLKKDAEAAYLAIIEAKAALIQAKYNVVVAKRDESAKKLLFELGRLARIDYDRAIVKRTEVEQLVKALTRSIELNYMKLNALMERPASDRYDVIKPTLSLTLPVLTDMPAAVERYKQVSDRILSQNEAVALAAKEVELVRGFGVWKTVNGVSTLDTLAEKERTLNVENLRLKTLLRNADYDFRIAWNNLQSSYETYVMDHGKYALSSKELEIARIRYERGLITPAVYLQAASSYEAARLTRQKSIQNFHLARGAFVVDFAIKE